MPNLINRTGVEEGAIIGDASGSALNTEIDLSITGFPSVSSCLSDLPQPIVGLTNRFEFLSTNIDSWRTRISAKLKSYGSTIAGLVTSSRSISHACDVNACAASSNTARLESLTDKINRLEAHISSIQDYLLLIKGILNNLCACSDSQLSFLIYQSQAVRFFRSLRLQLRSRILNAMYVKEALRGIPMGLSD